MTEWDKLLEQARNSPNNMRFTDLCKLAELAGFIRRKGRRGSHLLFHHPGIADAYDSAIPLQEGHSGKSKPYQVKQLLDLIEGYNLGPLERRR